VLDVRDAVTSSHLITFDARSYDDKQAGLLRMSRSHHQLDGVFTTPVSAFLRLPKAKILYSLTPQVLRLLQSGERFEPNVGTARQGMATWDDFRFIRLRWEVPSTLIGDSNVWEYLCKGGPYARYYGDIHLVVKWNRTGDEIRSLNIAANGTDAQARQASDYWRRPGATYSIRSGKGFSARVMPQGCLFTGQGPAILSESDVSSAAIIGWINSELITTLVELQSNAGKFMSGIIKQLLEPLPQRGGKPVEPGGVDHLERDPVEKVHLILPPEGVALHPDERLQGHGLQIIGADGGKHVGVGIAVPLDRPRPGGPPWTSPSTNNQQLTIGEGCQEGWSCTLPRGSYTSWGFLNRSVEARRRRSFLECLRWRGAL